MYTCNELNGRSHLYAVSPELIDRSFLYQRKEEMETAMSVVRLVET